MFSVYTNDEYLVFSQDLSDQAAAYIQGALVGADIATKRSQQYYAHVTGVIEEQPDFSNLTADNITYKIQPLLDSLTGTTKCIMLYDGLSHVNAPQRPMNPQDQPNFNKRNAQTQSIQMQEYNRELRVFEEQYAAYLQSVPIMYKAYFFDDMQFLAGLFTVLHSMHEVSDELMLAAPARFGVDPVYVFDAAHDYALTYKS